jgi:hypothetical protein
LSKKNKLDIEAKHSKTGIYLNKKDYIIRVKVIGKDYLNYIEVETHSGETYKCGDPNA